MCEQSYLQVRNSHPEVELKCIKPSWVEREGAEMVGNSCGSSQESKISTSYEPHRARARVWYCTQGAGARAREYKLSKTKSYEGW